MRVFKGYSTVERKWGNFSVYDLELAKRDLLNELYTRKGERLMSPEFGSIVWDLLFDPLTEELVRLLKEDTNRIVSKDPRLELKNLTVTEDYESQSIKLTILLYYVPTATVSELIAVFNRNIATNKLQG